MFKRIDNVSGEWVEKSFMDYAFNILNVIRVLLFVLVAAILNTVGLGHRNWQYWALLFIMIIIALLSSFVAALQSVERTGEQSG